MGMYPLIEDAMNKRFDELVATGMTEEEAAEAIADDQEARLTLRAAIARTQERS